jgi:3-hydroxy-9,10-secoandrosta-1,3,5(10)-triene-9,17-dione monooxygenase reductase component
MKREGIRQGLALIPSGIFILAAVEDGRCSAMLASFIQQAAFDPPLIVAAVQHSRPVRRSIQVSGKFAISILGTESKESLRRFWKGVPDEGDPFEGLRTRTHDTGIPVVEDAVGFLECTLRGTAEAGDHLVLIGEVTNGGRIAQGEPMVRIRKDGFDY